MSQRDVVALHDEFADLWRFLRIEAKSSLLHVWPTRLFLQVLDLQDFTMNLSLMSSYPRSVSAIVNHQRSILESRMQNP